MWPPKADGDVRQCDSTGFTFAGSDFYRDSDTDPVAAVVFGGMGLFMLGRMGGSWAMNYLHPEKLLALCAAGGFAAMLAVITLSGKIGLSGFFLCFLCESIMFPTIFALAKRGLNEQTKRASSFLIMSIVGGAIAPVLMGYIADTTSMALGFIVPLACFAGIGRFAIQYNKKD